MSYSKSYSRKELEEQIYIIKRQIGILNGNHYSIKQQVYKSILVQVSAILEEYLKSLFEDWIRLMKNEDIHMDKLPKSIWLWCLMKSQKENIGSLIVQKNEKKVLELFQKNKILMNTMEGKKSTKDILFPNEIIKDKKFPSTKNIKALFNRFGIEEIFKQIERRFLRNLELPVNSFLEIRNNIAHSYPSQDLTKVDVIRHVDTINNFVNCVDRIVFSHICKYTKQDCWQR